MAAITSLGVGSGLDLNTMVTQLVAAESQPLTQLQTAATKIQTQISGYGTLSSLLGAVQTAATALTSSTLWSGSTATSTDTASVSVLGGSSAASGNYSVSVQQLAGNQTVASTASLSDTSQLVGAGSMTLQSGSWEDKPPLTFVPTVGRGSTTIAVSAADTLETLREKINSAGAGVTASIVTDSSGSRLSLRSNTSGAENGFRVSVTDADGQADDGAGLSRFAYDPESSSSGMALKQSASNAKATVNGIAVESTTNDLSTVIDGLTLHLNKLTTSDATVAVTSDTASIKTAIQSFADAYNALASNIAGATKYDATTKVGGALQGDSAVGSLQQQLRNVLNTTSGASSTFAHLSDMGLQMQRNGTITVNSTKLDSALTNPTELKKAFANRDVSNAANNGFGVRYADLATHILGVDGTLTTRTAGLQKRLTENSNSQQAVTDRVDRYRASLVAQYTTLDANMSKLNNLSTYLTQQIAALNKSTA